MENDRIKVARPEYFAKIVFTQTLRIKYLRAKNGKKYYKKFQSGDIIQLALVVLQSDDTITFQFLNGDIAWITASAIHITQSEQGNEPPK